MSVFKKVKIVNQKVLTAFDAALAKIRDNTKNGIQNETETQKKARIKTLLADYKSFVSYYFTHFCKAESASFHIRLANEVYANPTCLLVKMWPRGHAKSTNACIMIPIWLMLNGKLKYMVLASQNEKSAIRLLSGLQAELEGNPRLISDFGDFKQPGSWEFGDFVTKNGVRFTAVGRGQSPRGLRERENRPDYIVCDDMDDDVSCQNPARVSRHYDWCMSALYNAQEFKTGRMIFVGNLISKTSILQKVADNPAFSVEKINAWDEEQKPAWWQNYTREDIQRKIDAAGYRLSQKELFHNPVSEGKIYKQEYFQFAPPPALSELKYLVVYTDPSFSSGAKSDFKATVVVGKTGKGGFWILKAYLRQTTVSKMVDWHFEIFDWANNLGIAPSFYIEANFAQGILIRDFKEAGEKQGRQLPILQDKRKKPDKFSRIEAMAGHFERGNVFVSLEEQNSADMQRLIEQFIIFEHGARTPDDGPDAVEGAIFILNTKTADAQKMSSSKREKNNRY